MDHLSIFSLSCTARQCRLLPVKLEHINYRAPIFVCFRIQSRDILAESLLAHSGG